LLQSLMPQSIYRNNNMTNGIKTRLGIKLCLLVFLVVLSRPGLAAEFRAADLNEISSLIGDNDSVLFSDPRGEILFAKNERKLLIPASILKIFTSLVSLHYLGKDYRFSTEFYIDSDSNLKVKGYGDPLLVSEVVKEISQTLAQRLQNFKAVHDLVMDDSYFKQPLTIPGVSSSAQPYDAPNGALCVNFNTVSFKRTTSGYVSAEPQTPLLPYALKKIGTSELNRGRIVFSHKGDEITIYAGKMFQYFLRENGIRFNGRVRIGRVSRRTDSLIYRHTSRFSVEQIVAKLLEFSNNFTTNQLLISCGIRAFGPPGTLNKGVSAALKYAGENMQMEGMEIFEGSGIYRKNRISAIQMDRILSAFLHSRHLMRREGREYYKTGTLHGVSTRAGFIESQNGEPHRYVVMMNTPGKTTRSVMRRILQGLE